MKKKKVLVIGMFDSIHLARWVRQFEDANVEILLFPSTHFKNIHTNLVSLRNSKTRIVGFALFRNFLGYVDTIACLRFLGSAISEKTRRCYLRFVIHINQPVVIHAIEIQHAGYLVSSLEKAAGRRILTNWGSDIYYYQHQNEHKNRIKAALGWATHYSAECNRDYKLARELGFNGAELPCIPNAGGFDLEDKLLRPPTSRTLILVKSYGGVFGLGNIAIDAIHEFLTRNSEYHYFFYSVTDDLVLKIENLSIMFPNRIRYATIKNGLTHDQMLALFLEAKVYLGCSRSDGLSTSFLEALFCGAYPIQTNTSCADEMIAKGAIGSIIEPEVEQILFELERVIVDEDLLLDAQKKNEAFVINHLNFKEISRLAQFFYL